MGIPEGQALSHSWLLKEGKEQAVGESARVFQAAGTAGARALRQDDLAVQGKAREVRVAEVGKGGGSEGRDFGYQASKSEEAS